jgi:hypothetical protein
MIFEAMLKNRIWEKLLNKDSNIETLKALQEAIEKNEISIYEAIDEFTKSK